MIYMENKKEKIMEKIMKTLKNLISRPSHVLTANTAKSYTAKQFEGAVNRVIKDLEHDIESKVRSISIRESVLTVIITKDLLDVYQSVYEHFKEVGFGTKIYDNSILPELGENRLLIISW